MSNQSEAREKLEAKVASLNLDELTTALVTFTREGFTAYGSVATRAITASIEARFPELDELVWEILDRELPGVVTYADALLLAREESGR